MSPVGVTGKWCCAGPRPACSTPNDHSAASRATSRCPNSWPPSSDTPTPAPNASVPPPRVQDGSSPKFHAPRDTLHDRAAGYWWELSMRQIETSCTLVFDAPRRARSFFEALVTDNLDIGRPELIELIFKRGQRLGRPARGEFKTKIVTYGTE